MSSTLLFTIPLLIVLGILGMYLMGSTKYKNLGRLLIVIGVLPIVAVFVLFILLIIGFSSYQFAFLRVLHMCIVGILTITFIAFICGLLWGVIKKKYVYIPICAVVALCICTFCGGVIYENYAANLPTVAEGEDLSEYYPYAIDTKVVSLDEEPELKLEGDVPVMDGATALYPVYSAFAKAVYPKEMLDGIIRDRYLDCSTTTGAYQNIVTGDADIIFVAAPSEQQVQFAKDNGVELVYTPIGKEAFVFFVNAKNKLDNITVEQIQKVYSGEIKSWGKLGVYGLGKIKAFQRDEGSGSQSALIRIMDGIKLMKPLEDEIVSAMGGIIRNTADYRNFKNAIGYSFRFYATEMVKNNQIKLLSVSGVEPTAQNIENGTYPLADNFYAVTRSDADEKTKKLVEWITGEQGQKLIDLTGYTPIMSN